MVITPNNKIRAKIIDKLYRHIYDQADVKVTDQVMIQVTMQIKREIMDIIWYQVSDECMLTLGEE